MLPRIGQPQVESRYSRGMRSHRIPAIAVAAALTLAAACGKDKDRDNAGDKAGDKAGDGDKAGAPQPAGATPPGAPGKAPAAAAPRGVSCDDIPQAVRDEHFPGATLDQGSPPLPGAVAVVCVFEGGPTVSLGCGPAFNKTAEEYAAKQAERDRKRTYTPRPELDAVVADSGSVDMFVRDRSCLVSVVWRQPTEKLLALASDIKAALK
jgi:hypothetical protein